MNEPWHTLVGSVVSDPQYSPSAGRRGHSKVLVGHENNDITAQYAEQIRDDTWGQTLAAKVGLGFQIPAFIPTPIVRNVRKNRQAVEAAVLG
jgi:hypothetical protein